MRIFISHKRLTMAMFFAMVCIASFAQIEGPQQLTVGDNPTYYGPAPGGQWWIYPNNGGSFPYQSGPYADITYAFDEMASVYTKAAGTFTIYYRLNGTDHSLSVNVTAGAPDAPHAPELQSAQCNLSVIRWWNNFGPPAGVNWWWQDTYNGRSQGFGQANSLNIPPSQTGKTWFLQSQNASTGLWGGTSGGITVDVTVPPGTASNNSLSRCGPGQVTLTTTPGSGATNVRWYTTPSGGTALGSNVVSVSTTTNYYAASYNSLCEASTRSIVSVTIIPIPTAGIINRLSPAQICVGMNFQVDVSGSSGSLLYQADYDDFEGPSENWVNEISDYSGGASFSYQALHPGNWRVRVRSGATCGPSDFSNYVTFTVWPFPGDPINKATIPSTICAGQTSVTLTATPIDGNEVRWYESAGSSTPISPNVGILSASRQYYVSSIRTSACEGNKYPMTVTVQPAPSAPSANDLSRCGPGQISLTTTPPSGSSLKWYTTSTGGTALSSNVVTVNSSTTYYASSLSAAGCESTSRAAVIVTIIPIPTAGIISRLSPTQICVGMDFQIQVSGSSGSLLYEADYDDFAEPSDNWVSEISDYSGAASFSYQALHPGNWRVRVRSGATCGPSAWSNYVTFTVWPVPGDPINKGTTPSTICAGQTSVTLTATPVDGNEVRWYETAGSSTPISPNVGTLSATRQYYVSSIRTGACEGNKYPMTVTVQPAPQAPSTNSLSRCGPGQITLTTAPPSGSSLKWYTASTGGTALTSNVVTVNSSTTYYASSFSAAGCESTSRTAVIVTVIPAPTAGIISRLSPAQICVGMNFQLDVSGSSGSLLYQADYDDFEGPSDNWVNEISDYSGAASFSYQALHPGNWRVRVRSGATCGPSDFSNYVTFTVWPFPGDPINKATIPPTICAGQTSVTLSATPVDGDDVRWYDTAGSTTPISPNVGTLSATRQYYVSSIRTGACEGNKYPMTVTVQPAPVAPSANDLSRCGPGQITLTTTPPSGASLKWYTTSTGGTALSSNLVTVNSSTTYYASSLSISGCESTSRAAVSATIFSTPVPGTLSRLSYTQICLGSNFNVEVSGGSGSPLYEADYFDQATSTWINVLSDVSGPENFSYPAEHIGNWRVRVKSGATCGPSAWSDGYVTFDVGPVPEPPIITTSTSTICAGGQKLLTATPGAGSTGVKWYEEPANGVAINGFPFQAGVPTPQLFANKHYWASSYAQTGNCESERVSIMIDVTPLPVDSEVDVTDNLICLGETVELSTEGGLGTEYWFVSKNGGTSWDVLSDVEGGPVGTGFAHTPEEPGTFLYRVRNNTGCGYCGTPGAQCSYFKSVAVTVVGEANPGEIAGESFVQAGMIGSYSATGHSFAESFNWSISNGQITSGQGTDHVTATFDGTATLTVAVSNPTCGPGGQKSKEIRTGINYIVEELLQVDGINDPFEVTSLDEIQKIKSITYFDGMGRSIQTIAWRNSPGHRDLVQPVVYDQFGRESLKFLPFTAGTNGEYMLNQDIINPNGSYIGIAQPFYSTDGSGVAVDPKPSAQTVFDNSPLNRVVDQGAPGVAWQIGSGHTITKSYQFNAAVEVLHFVYENDQLSFSTGDPYYAQNSLYKNVTYDEHQNDVQEFTNKEGQMICKKVRASSTEYACTYYVYDKKGQLVVVLPPEASKLLEGL